ncbi:MAG: hypothetical protein HN348_34290 [Proteobacteria bacterium]|jgi:hypothetical protein|nr:hypothetical protein [Pseudomonadota bacterium]
MSNDDKRELDGNAQEGAEKKPSIGDSEKATVEPAKVRVPGMMSGSLREDDSAKVGLNDEGYPKVVDLAMAAFEDMKNHFKGFLLSGVGMLIMVILVTVVSLVAVYAPLFIGLAMDSVAVMFGGMAVGTILAIGLSIALAIPMQASIGRAVDKHLRGEEDLGYSASYSTITEDMGKVIAWGLLGVLLGTLGVFACYVGAFAVSFLLHLSFPALLLHRMGVVESMKFSYRFTMEHPKFSLAFWGLGLAIQMILSYIPIVGMLLLLGFLFNYQFRGYRMLFGYGDTPEPFTAK